MNAAEKQIKELRKFQESLLNQGSRSLWQSPAETETSSAELTSFRAQEFLELPQDAAASVSDSQERLNRRKFMKYFAGATAVMGTAACSRRPQDYLVPYVRKPDALTYGVPVWYSSVSPQGLGVLVKTREGRPIKLEGNPDHPGNQNGLDARTHASILDLYNPERLRQSIELKSGRPLRPKELDSKVMEALSQARPGSVRLLTGAINSPSLEAELSRFTGRYSAKHVRHEDISYEAMIRAYEVVTGERRIPHINFAQADVVVSVDADFLGTWLRPLDFTKSFSTRRRVHHGDLDVNQSFVFESQMSNTGVSADYREPIKPSLQLPLLLAFVNELSDRLNFDPQIVAVAKDYSFERLASEANLELKTMRAAANALYSARSRSVVVSSVSGPQALEVQLVTIALNAALGNFSGPILWNVGINAITDTTVEFNELVQDMMDSQVDVLVIHGTNPVYSRPASDFATALSRVGTVITIGSELNETLRLGTYGVGESHYLESWGDCSPFEGVASIQQPVIQPLFETRSFFECLAKWGRPDLEAMDATELSRQLVQDFWREHFLSGASFDPAWREALRRGAITARNPSSSKRFSARWLGATALIAGNRPVVSSDSMEFSAYENIQMGDGRHANNAWLQELPETISKVTWDNYAGVSLNTAKKLGVHQQKMSDYNMDVVELLVAGRKIKLPVFVLPGMRDDVVSVALGYGRASAGSLGTGVGGNAFEFAQGLSSGVTQLSGQGVELVRTSEKYLIASTQVEFNLHGRDQDILQQTTLSEFRKDPEAAKDPFHQKLIEKNFSIYGKGDFVYPGHRWGMSIDLNTCTGCQACVVACSSENNVPIAGKDQVARGRHMAWMRIDLYHQGSVENPQSTYEPMTCQHCERAPCETVCPVLATVHTDDGLNAMVYNRCVGTRYCANNCPYKVRRFNYFQYSDKLARNDNHSVTPESPLAMMLNPDVTVRTRGIMEKCTYCVQRIVKGVDEVKAELGRDYRFRVPDGYIQTACQQSCPSDSIVFGDLNDENSEVAIRHKKVQQFKVLELLNTKPATSYLPRVRNTGSEQEA